MSTYRKIHGRSIQSVTTDPSESVAEGQLWYNSSSDTFKTVVASSGAWRSSAPLLVARDAAGSAGTQTTATIFGGNINPGNTSATDEYNGNGFSSGGALNTARRQTSGCGLQTAALCVGGYTTANAGNVEEYNGTSWAEQNDIPGVYRNGSTFGTQTAALYVGGYSAPVPNSTSIQIYDGTNWTTSPATLGTGGNAISSTGTSTAGLVFGGSNRLNLTEEWNGSAMSTGGNMSTSKYDRGSANQAPSENAMSAGGGIPAQTTVENYNGTSWSTLPSLAVATNSLKGAGTATSAMMMGGGPGAGPVFNTSTEFDKTAIITTAAAWASGANYPATIQDAAGSGPVTAAAIYGGYTSTYTNATNEYDGTSYSGGGNMNTGRACYQTGSGSQTAALQASGYATSAHTNSSEEYNGTSWSEGNNLTYSRYGAVGGGVQTSSLIIGGAGGPSPSSPNAALDKTEEYDGTSWTAGGDLPAAQAGGSGFSGTSSSSAIIAGFSPPNTVTLSYNGSSWTDVGHSLVQAVSTPAGGSQQGTSTAAVIAGGLTPAPAHTTFAQQYNGTSWVSAPSMSTARRGGAAAGTAASCLAVGGESPQKNNTEEFTGETSALNVKTLTQS